MHNHTNGMVSIMIKVEECAIEVVLRLIGGKWKTLILFCLFKDKIVRFGEFRRYLPAITQQMLTSQLREMERDGIVNRKVYPQVPPKVEYTLTEFGESMKPMLDAMIAWGGQYKGKSSND